MRLLLLSLLVCPAWAAPQDSASAPSPVAIYSHYLAALDKDSLDALILVNIYVNFRPCSGSASTGLEQEDVRSKSILIRCQESRRKRSPGYYGSLKISNRCQRNTLENCPVPMISGKYGFG